MSKPADHDLEDAVFDRAMGVSLRVAAGREGPQRSRGNALSFAPAPHAPHVPGRTRRLHVAAALLGCAVLGMAFWSVRSRPGSEAAPAGMQDPVKAAPETVGGAKWGAEP